MLKVVICCGAGMSSSYLTQRLQKETINRGLEKEVSFDFFSLEVGIAEAKKVLDQYDVAMCCPHLKYVIDELCKRETIDCAIYIMPPKMYGTLYYDEVYQDAKDVYEQFQISHMNPFHFPGEESILRIKRCEAYRNRNNHRYD